VSGAQFRVGLSVSPLSERFQTEPGFWYSDGTREVRDLAGLQRLYIAHGATEVYARVATTRHTSAAGNSGTLEQALAKARLAAELDLDFNPEFGLWETYGDIGGQPGAAFDQFPELGRVPPWETLTADQMEAVLRDYGAIVAAEVLATGARVVSWNIGNEVDFGVAGVGPRPPEHRASAYRPPDRVDPEIGRMTVLGIGAMPVPDQVAWLREHVWPHQAKLLRGFAAGLRSVDPEARVSTHLAGVMGTEFVLAFWTCMREEGYLPDTIGTSYYPSNNINSLSFAEITEMMAAIQESFSRPVMIAEFGYPAEPMLAGSKFGDWNREIPGYAHSAADQARLLQDLTGWLLEHGGAGIRPWAPEVVEPHWAPMALFDPEAGEDAPRVARPSLDSIKRALNASVGSATP
jgi:arabinogalactan endo-1,4-beta-galactosidase